MPADKRSSLNRRDAMRAAFIVAVGPSICAASGKVCCQVPAAGESALRLEQGLVHIDLKQAPQLTAKGGAVRVDDEQRKVRLIVVHTGKRQFVAADQKCTHGGGALTYVPKGRVLHCTCWGHSRFALDGNVVTGPAKRKLRIYETTLAGDTLTIKLENKG
jgi:Rieske Fe-S protein